jgi:hypothetical protein
MTFRYPRRLAYLEFSVALVMALALYVSTQPRLWGWLLFLPLFLSIVLEGVRTYMYALTIEGDCISVAGFKRAQYLVSEITAINVWIAKGERIAVLTFSDRSKLSFPSHLEGFKDLVDLLRKQTNLPQPISES